jgi:hypothetical protein
VKQRYIRPDGELSDDMIVVVRGGDLVSEILERDARRAHEIYGTYAISVFAADGVTVDELAQEPPLVRFASITLMTVGAIRAAGLRLSPSGRNPLHHSIDFDELESGVAALMVCEHRTILNPYHEA